MARGLCRTAAGSLLLAALAACQTSRAVQQQDAVAPGFDPAVVRRGGELAILGNCISCHTARDGKPYAGGLAMNTPVGTLYSTNITPDSETGIGRWTEEDFFRAMEEGLAPGGRHLYPAFPYDHFTHVAADDLHALYAFFMTREPVHAPPRDNRLAFPFSMRGLLAGWNMLFLHETPWQPDPAQSDQWNRGAYLAEGLAHCGACHTPRNMFLAEERSRPYAGGEIEGWDAPPLEGTLAAASPWSEDQLFEYLRRGGDDAHGSAAGPMQPVTRNLAQAPEADVRAIAVYFASLMRTRSTTGRESSRSEPPAADVDAREAGGMDAGAALFNGACAECHGVNSPRTLAGRPLLGATTSIHADSPRNAIQIVLHGIRPEQGQRGAYMPPFDATLSDSQVAAVLSYVRSHFGGGAGWRDLEGEVGRIRSGR